MAELWIWVDPHLDHPAIIDYCDRPFANLKEMNDCLMDNYNDCVKPKDDVLLLGDIAFKNHAKFVSKLNGHKTFVFGNHDRMPFDVLRNFTRVVGSSHCPGILEMSVGKFRVCFSHYPLASWGGSYHGTWNVHGHCHGRMPEFDTMLRTDAGVDLYNFCPANFDVLRDKLELRSEAWRKLQRDRVTGESGGAFEDNKAKNRVFVDRWRKRMEADPAFFNIDYRQRYGCHGCNNCSRSVDYDHTTAGDRGNVHAEVIPHQLSG